MILKMNFKKLMAASLTSYRINFPRLWGITAIFLVPFLIMEAYVLRHSTLWQILAINLSPTVSKGLYLITVVGAFVLFLLYYGVIIKYLVSADKGIKSSIPSLYREASGSLGSVLKVMGIYFFKVLMWSFVFLIPGIIFGVLNSFAVMAVLVEGKQGKEAFVASQKMIRPFFLKFLDYFLFVFLLLAAFYIPPVLLIDLLIRGFVNTNIYMWSVVAEYLELGILIFMGHFLFVFGFCFYKEFKG